MKKSSLLLLPVALVTMAVLYQSGCGLMDGAMDSPDVPALLSVYPVDGDSLVPADADCFLVFDGPMNQSSCERNFHLHHGDHEHQDGLVDGGFHWSADSDTMFFDPHELMDYHSDYTIHLNDGMMGMGGHQLMMGAHFFHGLGAGMGHGMMGSGDEVTNGEWYFRTAR
jgi:hypothetical protein